MAFYIKPPGGTLSLKRLHQDAEIRLLFLYQLHHQYNGTKDLNVDKIFKEHPIIALHSESLIDSSLRDRISHFVLRLASLKNKSFQTFVIEAETYLFKSRVMSGGPASLKLSLQSLERHTRFALKHQILNFHHRELLQHMLSMVCQVSSSGMLDCEDRSTCQHSISVPWTMANSLVKDRSVELTNGKAVVSCHLFFQLLYSVFQDVLIHGIKELSSSENPDFYPSDPRMNSIMNNLISTFIRLGGRIKLNVPFNLTARSIDFESKFFPLCMHQLHGILSKTNRLRHHARLRYTLFLKDIGLPVTENIIFWEQFYSKPYSGTATSCSHSWTGSDGNRYLYSIRHLYGLEGGRISYTSHSCASLQALSPQPSEMAGCPFTSRDYEEVISILKTFYGEKPFLDGIMKQVMDQKPTAACKLLMRYSQFSSDDYFPSKDQDSPHDSPHKNSFGEKRVKKQTRKPFSAQGKCVNSEQMVADVCDCCLSKDAVKGRCSVRHGENKTRKYFNGKKRLPTSQLNGLNGEKRHNLEYSANANCDFVTKSNGECEHTGKLLVKREIRSSENSLNYVQEENKSCRLDAGNCSGCESSQSQDGNVSLYDIEDSDFNLLQCNFLRPSQYYLFVKSNR